MQYKYALQLLYHEYLLPWEVPQADPQRRGMKGRHEEYAEQSQNTQSSKPIHKPSNHELFAGSGDVTVWINSPGGDCVAASQIYTMLMDYKGDVTVKIDGLAASAASVIAMAGTRVLMAPTALLMIHNPVTMAYGDHEDMQKAIELLDEVKESIINVSYRTGRGGCQHLPG